jgi:hypothetical protein
MLEHQQLSCLRLVATAQQDDQAGHTAAAPLAASPTTSTPASGEDQPEAGAHQILVDDDEYPRPERRVYAVTVAGRSPGTAATVVGLSPGTAVPTS